MPAHHKAALGLEAMVTDAMLVDSASGGAEAISSLRALQLPAGSSHVLREDHANVSEPNNAAMVMYPVGPRVPETVVVNGVAVAALKAGFFEEMRTQKQLGYAVGLHRMSYGETECLAMQLQSTKVTQRTD